ncbi:MAG: D-glycero-beta-D-manno-heptose 1,7-bisphosphate 7-phosphatase [Isosphaeraceae bacterium]
MSGASSEPAAALRPAVFLDRDGTIIEHVHYLADPGLVRLLPGAARALIRLRGEGFVCVVVTNQSAVGRGMLSEARLGQIHDEMVRQLAAEGTGVDAIYYCPEIPMGDNPSIVEREDRKPGPGMLVRAAHELSLDLDASWMVGDMVSDILAGINAGCRGSILVRSGKPVPSEGMPTDITYDVANDLFAAAETILAAKDQRFLPSHEEGAGSARAQR